VKEDNPNFNFGDVGKELGRRWREISDADRVPFDELSKGDKERYIKEKAAYDSKV